MAQINFWIQEMEVAKSTYEALQVQYLTQLIHNSVTIFNVTMQEWATFDYCLQFLQDGNHKGRTISRFQDIFSWQTSIMFPSLYHHNHASLLLWLRYSGHFWILIVEFLNRNLCSGLLNLIHFLSSYWDTIFINFRFLTF